MNTDDDAERFFPEPFVRRLDETHRARAEMSHVEALLGDWGRLREWLSDEDGDERGQEVGFPSVIVVKAGDVASPGLGKSGEVIQRDAQVAFIPAVTKARVFQ